MAVCSKCSVPHDRNGRYCRSCHTNYMREWRKDRRELKLSAETIRAGEAALELAVENDTPPAETAKRIFVAMLGPRAKHRKVA